MSKLEISISICRSKLEAAETESVRSKAAADESAALVARMRAQIAAQGDTIETAEAELNDQRAICGAKEEDLVQMKKVMERMSEDEASVQPDRVQTDAYQAHLIAQIKSKNKELLAAQNQYKEVTAEFRQTKAKLARANKEVGVAKAKIESQRETLTRYSKKEAGHIRMLREKDAALADNDAMLAQQKSAIEECETEVQAAFDDLTNAMDRIEALKRENAKVVGINSATEKSNGELGVSARAAERELEDKTSEILRMQELHQKVSEQNDINAMMYREAAKEEERLRIDIAEVKAELQSRGGGGSAADVDDGRTERTQEHHIQQIVAENNDLQLKVKQRDAQLELLTAQLKDIGVEPCFLPPPVNADDTATGL